MRAFLRCTATVLLVMVGVLAHAQQDEGTGYERERPMHFGVEDLRDEHAHVTGEGNEIPAIDLRDEGRPRHWIGDDTAFAARAFDDRTWPLLYKSEDSLVPGANVHWVRYHLHPDRGLKSAPLVLNVSTYAAVEVFHNGRSILRTAAMPSWKDNGDLPLADSLPGVSAAFRFACDGEREVIAVRLEGIAGMPLKQAALELTLRSPGSAYGTQRVSMHFGLFVGVNLIILVLSVILWFQDRRETSWLMLGLLSLIEAFDSVIGVAGEPGLLGFSTRVSGALDMVSTVLTPWPLFLLIMVLRKLRGDLDAKSARLYMWGVGFATVLCAVGAVGKVAGKGWFQGFTGADTGSSPWIVVLMVLAVIVLIPFGLVFLWFAVDVVRLAIKLLRTKGYERLIGGGALVACILPLFKGFGEDSWMGIAGQYCDHVAVPVAVAIYLAIRSAHNNKAVARQRDDLDREVYERTAELSLAKKRSDDLLLNILPYDVAEELKQTGSAAAKHFDQATVMFTDFKGFTAMSERMAPGALLDELNTCFKAFDDIIARHGIEKIKTIGDAYMCVGGLPDPKSSTPAAVVHAALEMQVFMRERQVNREARGQLAFVMRVGIHSGPVVAGIVGVKKFQYDIWGDTVNTASRMESSGAVEQVNISESTYVLVRDVTEARDGMQVPAFSFTPRGKVQAKGKGELEMYFVERTPAAAEGFGG